MEEIGVWKEWAELTHCALWQTTLPTRRLGRLEGHEAHVGFILWLAVDEAGQDALGQDF